MNKYIELTVGAGFIFFGIVTIVASILGLVLSKESRLYKFLINPYEYKWQLGSVWFSNFMKNHISERTKCIINIALGIALLLVGLNVLMTGLIYPIATKFWILF